jgi:hypothetical protein
MTLIRQETAVSDRQIAKLILAGPGWNRQYQTCPPMLRKV